MATTTALQGIPVPQASDTPNGPTQMTSIANALEKRAVMTFASAAARTSAFTAASISPAAGMLSYRTDGGLNGFEYWNPTASAWRVFGRYQDSQTLVAAAGSVTFSAIPSYLKTVSIMYRARSDTALAFTNVDFRISGDSTNSYRHVVTFNQNGSWGPPIAISGSTSARFSYVTAAGTTSAIWGAGHIDFIGWDKPVGNALKGVGVGGYYDSAGGYVITNSHCDYAGGSAYTSITLLPGAGNFITGSEFALSGLE